MGQVHVALLRIVAVIAAGSCGGPPLRCTYYSTCRYAVSKQLRFFMFAYALLCILLLAVCCTLVH